MLTSYVFLLMFREVNNEVTLWEINAKWRIVPQIIRIMKMELSSDYLRTLRLERV